MQWVYRCAEGALVFATNLLRRDTYLLSGFLASDQVFPTKNAAVAVLSNSDGNALTGQLAQRLAQIVLGNEPAPAPESEMKQVEGILAGLQQGKLDRDLFTSNANSYFTPVALGDFQSSLSGLGPLKQLTKSGENLRGGMTHRSYRARYEKGNVGLNIYVIDGKYEQFMITGQ